MLSLALSLAVASAAPADALDAVVLVVQGSTVCAGAVVDPAGTVVTAYHCVASGGRPAVQTRDGRRVPARIANLYVASDLAVLRAPELAGADFLTLRPEAPPPGEAVHALGHPLGALPPAGFYEGALRWSITSGVVAAVGTRSLQVTAPVNPGNSGGPVVDDDGRLVGVVSRRLVGDGLGFAARVEHVRALLEEGDRRTTPIGGTWGVELVGASLEGADGVLSGGVRAEAAFRDRLVTSAEVGVAPSARWDAVRFGRIRWTAGLLRLGVRQRIGRGPWAARADLSGGVAWVQTLRGTPDLVTRGTLTPSGWVGGTITLRNVGVELGGLLPAGDLRAAIVLRWPGVLGVF